MRLIIIVTGMVLIQSTMCGCGGFDTERWTRRELGLEYILDMEDAGKITEWTLAQKDPAKVIDGLASLEYIITTWKNQRQRQAATAGYSTVYRRILGGWPGAELQTVPWTDRPVPASEHALRVARLFLGGMHREHVEDPLITSLWNDLLALDPPLKPFGEYEKGGIFDPKPPPPKGE